MQRYMSKNSISYVNVGDKMQINFNSGNKFSRKSLREDDEIMDAVEYIQTELYKIADNLGYSSREKSSNPGTHIISISNNVNVIIKYNTKINNIFVTIGKYDGAGGGRVYNCTNNSADVENISVSLQTASMICDEIRRKLM